MQKKSNINKIFQFIFVESSHLYKKIPVIKKLYVRVPSKTENFHPWWLLPSWQKQLGIKMLEIMKLEQQ